MGLELLTDVPLTAIKEVIDEIKKGANPMSYKKMMAFGIVKAIRGEEEAVKAQRAFEATVQNKEIPADIPVLKKPVGNYKLMELLVEAGLAKSKSEAGRLVDQGGVKVDNKIIADREAEVAVSDKEVLIQKGKRGFIRVIKN
jgi:tyrosyl-tRNA synthetase